MNLRLDETVTFTIAWVDSLGNPAPAPEGLTVFCDHPEHATVTDQQNGTYEVRPVAIGTTRVGVSSPTLEVLDSVTVEAGVAASGSVVWGTPGPLVI